MSDPTHTPSCFGLPTTRKECVLCQCRDVCYQQQVKDNDAYLLPNQIHPPKTEKARGAGYATEPKANLPWEGGDG
jgi:hypothetical protein